MSSVLSNININTQKRKVVIGDTEVSWAFIKHLNEMLVSIERTEKPYVAHTVPWNTTLFRGTHDEPTMAKDLGISVEDIQAIQTAAQVKVTSKPCKATPRTSNADSMAEAILGSKPLAPKSRNLGK